MDPAVLIFDTLFGVSGGSTPRLMFQARAAPPFDWSGIERGELAVWYVDRAAAALL